MNPTRGHILTLYRQLIRYSDSLQFTDKGFYLARIRKEFKTNKKESDPSRIQFLVQVSPTTPDQTPLSQRLTTILYHNHFLPSERRSFFEQQTSTVMSLRNLIPALSQSIARTLPLHPHHHLHHLLGRCSPHPLIGVPIRSLKSSIKQQIDYTKYPKLDEKDLVETFVYGSGPGGQSVNKTHNCVNLKHVPTGIQVKCHIHREKKNNQKEARILLADKVDYFLNGEQSVKNQIKRIDLKNWEKFNAKKHKLRQLKEQFKEKEKKVEEDHVSES